MVVLSKKDRFGNFIKEGDFLAEGTVGEFIWNGRAFIVERPVGKVIVTEIENDDLPFEIIEGKKYFYNLQSVKTGLLKLVKNGEYDFLDSYVDEKGLGKLYLDCWDGVFLDWNNVEIINFDGLEICETH